MRDSFGNALRKSDVAHMRAELSARAQLGI